MRNVINLTPFLLFDGNCAQAMEFYKSCFGGELTITKLGDTPMKNNMPKSLHDRVVYAHLKADAIEFSATDWQHATRKPQQGNMVCMYITGGTYADLRKLFDKLAEGAPKDLLDDLQEMPFGTYGHLADQYGVHWFFKGDAK